MKNSVLITTAFYVLLFLNCAGQDKTKTIIREPVVAGTFYPSNPVELKMQLATFFGVAEKQNNQRKCYGNHTPSVSWFGLHLFYCSGVEHF